MNDFERDKIREIIKELVENFCLHNTTVDIDQYIDRIDDIYYPKCHCVLCQNNK